ncbi:MAG: UDP-glucose 4-epimerase GalE [Proteobacteria bacterium]|nr:UDP-glucose 4-epimerase GalE [Pseudomonadota bacterium]MBU4470436.1 UDP-glucose 4-epimerase GalE [Pseudomonadota bacterium]MCG2753489.1 UDP-glucose 4-epimerase GalE [Desulfobacteraceae bacterium]
MSNILVTGGAGYIGSHACKALKQAGFNPVTYDNLEYGHEWAVKWGPLEEGDILDRSRLETVLKKYDPKAVMHFAAYTYVGESVENPGKYYRNNVAGSLTLLEAMRNRSIQKIIFSSTCATYGIPQCIPLAEDHGQFPISPYGKSKFMIEQMLKDFDEAHGIKFVGLRYFNAAGADPDAEIGEEHNPETHLIPLVLDAAMGKSEGIKIFGTDYDTPDGTCIRDYIHVTDLADAHVKALGYLVKEGKSDFFNLGNGSGFSVREVIENAEKTTKQKIPVIEWQRRPGDPAVLIGSSEKALKILNWQPKYNNLETIIKTAWAWANK